jgi:hypothetical protein
LQTLDSAKRIAQIVAKELTTLAKLILQQIIKAIVINYRFTIQEESKN